MTIRGIGEAMDAQPTTRTNRPAADHRPPKPKAKRLDDDLLAALRRVARTQGIEPGVPFH